MRQNKIMQRHSDFLSKYHSAASGKESTEQFINIFAKVAKEIETKLSLTLYDEQIVCAKALLENKVIEMNTGEGKTFSAILAAGVYHLKNMGSNKKTIIITYNNYLAQRDSKIAQRCLADLGISVGCAEVDVLQQKKDAYKCDITYCTITTLMDDYVNASVVNSVEKCYDIVFDYAIVDEADGVMISQARTNFVKAKKKETPFANMLQANLFVKDELTKDDYIVSKLEMGASLSDSGISKMESFFNFNELNEQEKIDVKTCVSNALTAFQCYQKDVHYVVKDERIKLINQNTGRISEDSTFVAGLHQAIENKEGLPATDFSEIVATMTYQGLLSKFNKIGGMSGTILDDSEEFKNVYGLKTEVIPPHFKNIRIDQPNLVFVNETDKMRSLIQRVCSENEKGRPVLIGVPTTELSEKLSEAFKKKGLKHSLLNANRHAEEAEMIAKAGQVGAITIATNMAGRGTDILVADEVNQTMGGLLILGAERNNSKRADKQLLGRTGRQGAPGETQFYISLDDGFAQNFNGMSMSTMAAIMKKQEDMSVKLPIVNMLANEAQKTLDGSEFDARKEMIRMYKIIDAEMDYLFNINRCTLLKEPSVLQTKKGKKIQWVNNEKSSTFSRRERENISKLITDEIGVFVRKNLELRSKIRFSAGVLGNVSAFKKANEAIFEETIDKINNILIENIL